MDSLEGRQPGELQAELDGKLAALRRRAGALAAEDGPTRQVRQAAALYHQACAPPPHPLSGDGCCRPGAVDAKAPQVPIEPV